MAVQIQYRRGEAAEWTAVNPTLAIGEPGYETDTGRIKIGDGATAWNDLVYTAANSLLSGDGPPDNVTDGKLGDFYIDTLNDSIYGPKTEAGWGVGVDFVVSTINGLLDVDTVTDPPEEGEALIWNPTGGDGTGAWVPGPAGAEASGAVGQIQYNDGASPTPGLAASADLTWDDTAKELSVGGDINLDDGGTFATTLQLITSTANRTISFPDATGTVALVGGSSGQLVYNNAGAYTGAPSTSVGATGSITLSLNGAASTPPLKLTGTWFSGGTSTTTKPQLLIEPAGTTSTAWNTSGTGLGVNAPSTFNGNLIDLQLDGASKFKVLHTGTLITTGSISAGPVNINSNAIYGVRLGWANSPNWGGIPELNMYSGSATTGFIQWNADLYLYRDAADTLAQRRGTNAQTYRLYNTYTDASNYQRTSITDDSTGLVIDQQYAGTGAARTNLLQVRNNGDAKLTLGAQGNGTFVYNNGSGGISVASNGVIGINENNNSVVNIGQTGAFAAVNLRTSKTVLTNGVLIHTPVTVSALPAAATVGAGARGFVSDSTVAASGNFGATVTGGGSNNVPVFSDGTNWLIG